MLFKKNGNLFSTVLTNKYLIYQLSLKDIKSRYKGSFLGILWSFLTPILMLIIYTFVFSVVFKARWGIESENRMEFALILFCGLNVFNFFTEAITRSTSIILANENYVKKVLFPLEILPITIICSSLFNSLIGFSVLIITLVIFTGAVHWTVILFPFILIPFIMFTLGICWILASLGVFIRDINNLIGIVSMGLMFLSPIFYPITAIPENLRYLYYFNPITYIVEDLRKVILWGQMPNISSFSIQLLVGIVVLIIGYVWFERTKEGFIDVM